MSKGEKGDAQHLATEEKDWNLKKHECCLTMDRKSRLQWEFSQKENMSLTVARKIH